MAGTRPRRGASGGADWRAPGAGAPPSKERIGWPTEILSPTATRILATLPAEGEGTGATALPVSSSMMPWPFGNLIAFLDQNADHAAGVNAFTQRR